MSNVTNKLFLIGHIYNDDEGDARNEDLFVIAPDAAAAIEIWRKAMLDGELDDESGATPDIIEYIKESNEEVREKWRGRKPDGVWLVREEHLLCRAPRALDWGKEIERVWP